ncbi:MAG: hypothetical protein DMF90_17790 [Acidobacteria bacterium]|nr:MAG: hypothetical protein DMF90_17790 [Acidobacteriota bacterium]
MGWRWSLTDERCPLKYTTTDDNLRLRAPDFGLFKLRAAGFRLRASGSDFGPERLSADVLLKLAGGSLAHFELAPGQTTLAVPHRRVDSGGHLFIWSFRAALSFQLSALSFQLSAISTEPEARSLR